MTNQDLRKGRSITSAVVSDGILVRLIFAAENNVEIPSIVSDILKYAYLQRKNV